MEKVLPAPDCLQDGSSGHPCRQQEGRDEAVGVGREAPRVMCTSGYLRPPCDQKDAVADRRLVLSLLRPVVGVGVSQAELALWWPGRSSLKPVAEVAAL